MALQLSRCASQGGLLQVLSVLNRVKRLATLRRPEVRRFSF
jgi:hypothetical protein